MGAAQLRRRLGAVASSVRSSAALPWIGLAAGATLGFRAVAGRWPWTRTKTSSVPTRARTFDRVEQSSLESFPASDPPSWIPLTSLGPPYRPEP